MNEHPTWPSSLTEHIEAVKAAFDGPPRDPARIGPMLDMLKAYWNTHPDLRLGQIIVNLSGGGDPFYVEDDQMDGMLRTALKEGV